MPNYIQDAPDAQNNKPRTQVDVNLNWDHILPSYGIQSFATFLANSSPNSMSNAVKNFNNQQLPNIPYTSNNSVQDLYGMKMGGKVRRYEEGGFADQENVDEWMFADEAAAQQSNSAAREEPQAATLEDTNPDDSMMISFMNLGSRRRNRVFSSSDDGLGFRAKIGHLESEGEYDIESKNSSAVGKYQFLWNTWKDNIGEVTGVTSKEEFKKSPKAQEDFMSYYEDNILNPQAAHLSQMAPGYTPDQLKALLHFKGTKGAVEWITQGIDKTTNNNASVPDYLSHFKKGGKYLKHAADLNYEDGGESINMGDPDKPYDRITNPDGYKITRFPGDTLTNNQISKVAEDLWTKGENYHTINNSTLVQNGVNNKYPLSATDVPKVKTAFDNMGWFGRTWNAMSPYNPKNTTIPQPQYAEGGDIQDDPPVKRKPIIVTNPNDARLKAYSDSLKVYEGNNNWNSKVKLAKSLKDLDLNDPERLNTQNIINRNNWSAPLGTLHSYADGTGFENIFPKPVQPVVYQKPQTKSVEYTDPLEFKVAQQKYNDSLNLYNKYPASAVDLEYNSIQGHYKDYKKDVNESPNLRTIYNNFDFTTKHNIKPVAQGNFGAWTSIPGGGAGNKRDFVYKKPVDKPVLKEQLYPIQGAQKGNISIQQGQQATIPEPTGQPVYGPSNGLIGYQTSNGFQPTLRRDHLAKNNQADLDLLSNPEALKKYVAGTPRYKMGGAVYEEGQEYDISEEEIAALEKQGYKIDRLK